MNELAVREPYQPDRIIQRSGGVYERDIIDGWVQVLDDVSKLANFIAETDFVPRALRNRPAAVAACILTGRELGIGPMQSLKSIHMVQGVPSLSAEYKRARALAAGHDIVFDETTGTRCVVRGRRDGSDRWVTITWTIEMGRRAKLAGKDVWQQYPQRMLQARASSELCDLIFPDASLGLATMEVLEDGGIVAESGETVDVATGEVTSGTQAPAIEAAKPKTAQRASRRPTAAAPAESSGQAPQKPPAQGPAPAATAPSGDDLPPLPGEEEDPATSGASSSARAPGPSSPAKTAEQSPSSGNGSVTGPQLTRIWATLTGSFGFPGSDKDAARQACADIIGRELPSSKGMTIGEASTVIDTLGCCEHVAFTRGGEPRQILDGILADPRGVALVEFQRLGYTGESVADTAGAVLRVPPPASLESLTAGQASLLAARLAGCASKDDVDALLKTGEVPGE